MEFEEFDIEFLAQKMSEDPRSPLFARLADLYIGKEQVVEAVKLTEDGIKLFPTYCSGYIVLGKAHLALKEFSKAISAFEKAIELSPFNQTAEKLLQSVPNRSDESTRTTDGNYFSEAPIAATDRSDTVSEIPDQIHDIINSEMSSEIVYDQPTVQLTNIQPEIQSQSSSEAPILSFDEYFVENQHRITGTAEKKLDDYLNELQIVQDVPVSREIDPAIFTDTTLETSTTDISEHLEPEVVFASPEQAQLFAEMQEEAVPEPDQRKQSSDLDTLAEKLQSAEKIIPQENYQPKTPVPEAPQDDQVYETDAVTPTLAEIYASQGELRAAIQAYEILMFSQPAKGGEFQKRIRELQQLQMEKDGLI